MFSRKTLGDKYPLTSLHDVAIIHLVQKKWHFLRQNLIKVFTKTHQSALFKISSESIPEHPSNSGESRGALGPEPPLEMLKV